MLDTWFAISSATTTTPNGAYLLFSHHHQTLACDTMRTFTSIALALLAASVSASSDEEPSHTTQAPLCTATSSTGSGAYFDLRPDTAWPEDSGKAHKHAVHKDYHAKGYDYGKNFTMNICSSVIEPVWDVVGVEESMWKNVSAYYTSHGNIYSIGSVPLCSTRYATG